MGKGIFKSFYLVHGLLLAVVAIGFLRFWRRTGFWLPKYVHALAVFGLAVGIWTVSQLPADAPINQYSSVGKFVLAIAVPAMVYFVFVIHGGQRGRFPQGAANGRRRFDWLRHSVPTVVGLWQAKR